jgi:hypothetical protein
LFFRSMPSFYTRVKDSCRRKIHRLSFNFWNFFGSFDPPFIPDVYPLISDSCSLQQSLELLADLANDMHVDYEQSKRVHSTRVDGKLMFTIYDEPQKLAYEPRLRKNTIITLVQECRNKFPLFRRSEANRLVARKYIYERMVEIGMRPSHVRNALDLAVSLVFTPDEADLDVENFELSHAYRTRIQSIPHYQINGNGLYALVQPQGYTTT